MKIALFMLVLAVVAQFPGCGGLGSNPNVTQQGEIVGFVDDKYVNGQTGTALPYILIGATEYEVPWNFFREVSIGDLVKFSNGIWTIVRKVKK